MEALTKEELKQYLKENLRIELNVTCIPYVGYRNDLELKLENECICVCSLDELISDR